MWVPGLRRVSKPKKLADLDKLTLVDVAHQDDPYWKPCTRSWPVSDDDDGQLSVITHACTYSQHSFVPSASLKTFVGLKPNPAA